MIGAPIDDPRTGPNARLCCDCDAPLKSRSDFRCQDCWDELDRGSREFLDREYDEAPEPEDDWDE